MQKQNEIVNVLHAALHFWCATSSLLNAVIVVGLTLDLLVWAFSVKDHQSCQMWTLSNLFICTFCFYFLLFVYSGCLLHATHGAMQISLLIMDRNRSLVIERSHENSDDRLQCWTTK